MLGKKTIIALAIAAVCSAGVAAGYFNGGVPSHLKIGAERFGDNQVIKVGDEVIGDPVTIKEFKEIRSNYRENGFNSKEALGDFTKLVLFDKSINKILPKVDYEDTRFYKSNRINIDDGSDVSEDIKNSFGLDYENVQKAILISEAREDFDKLLVDSISKSDSLASLYDSVTRKIIVDDYLVDLSQIDVVATEEEFWEFYNENSIRLEDVIDVEIRKLVGIKERKDLEAMSSSGLEDLISSAGRYQVSMDSLKISRKELSSIMGVGVDFKKDVFFIDDNSFDVDGSAIVYIVKDIVKGDLVSVDDARELILPALTNRKKSDYANGVIEERVDAGDSIDKIYFLTKVDSKREYNIVDDYDSELFEVLIGLSEGDLYSYIDNEDIHILNIIETDVLDTITEEQKGIINDYYAGKIRKELLKFNELILFNGIESKSYNFEEF